MTIAATIPPDMSVLPPESLIDDICSLDPARVAAALQAAAPHRATLAPVLLARLMQTVVEPQRWTAAEGQPCPVFLSYLAAEWRLTDAHPLLVALLRLPPDDCSAVLGDFITEGAKLTLADTWPGDLRAIRGLALDERAEPFARGAALKAAAILVARRALPRETALALLTESAALPLDPDNEDHVIFAGQIVSTSLDLRAWELRGTVTALFERDLVDPSFCGDLDEVLEEIPPGRLPDFTANHVFPPTITDAWAAVRRWGFFDEQHPGRDLERLRNLERYEDELLGNPHETEQRAEPVTFRRETPKVGRNDPCPCGSGKKFKKCCGA